VAVGGFPEGEGEGEGQIGVAMIEVLDDVVPGQLTTALASLDTACRDLDDAVLVLSDVPGDDVMASPSLVALLLRVVVARRHVMRLKIEAAGSNDNARALTVS
jgi:hypothetical protein